MSRTVFIYLFSFLLCSYSCVQQRKSDQIQEEMRIISLSPHITEIIYALNQEANLIAVTDYCSYPAAAREKEKIGGLLNPNLEKIVSLKPTHLFGQPAHEQLNLSLKTFDLSVVMMPNETVADVQNTITSIGTILGCKKKAQWLVAQIRDSLTSRKKERTLLRAMLVIGKNAGDLKNIMVAGEGTFIDEIWQRVGGQNIYNDLPGRYQTISLESIFIRDPDIIILFDPLASAGVHRGNFTNEWSVLSRIKAFQLNNLFTLGGDYVLIPGPRMIQLANDMRVVIEKSMGK